MIKGIPKTSTWTRQVVLLNKWKLQNMRIQPSSSISALKSLATDTGVSRTNVKTILHTGQPDQHVRVQGWVRALRKQKTYVFVDLNDGSTWDKIPVVIKAKDKPPDLTLYSSIDVTGVLVPTPRNVDLMELHPTFPVTVLGTCDQTKYPLAGKEFGRHDPDLLRQHAHLRFKNSKFASLLRLRSATSTAIHNFFTQNDFTQIHTPVLTANDCEGAGEVFIAKPFSEKLIQDMAPTAFSRDNAGKTISRDPDEVFFNSRAFLTVSSQLHLEAAVGGLDRVWTMSPVFRAENAQSTRHLAEFYMVEAELAFAYQIQEILSVMEDLVKFCINHILFESSSEWNYCCEDQKDTKNLLERILKKRFTIMTFNEARKQIEDNMGTRIPDGQGLNREQELFLVEKRNDDTPVFVINWPRNIKPFYMRRCIDDPELVSAVDLLVPRIGELCGGSLRENDMVQLDSNVMALDPSGKLKQSMAWYFELREFGGVPSGGFGLGFDRLLQLLLGRSNIKDVTPFPRWAHNCPINAFSSAQNKQLDKHNKQGRSVTTDMRYMHDVTT